MDFKEFLSPTGEKLAIYFLILLTFLANFMFFTPNFLVYLTLSLTNPSWPLIYIVVTTLEMQFLKILVIFLLGMPYQYFLACLLAMARARPKKAPKSYLS
jgi:hypothetical protein